MARSAGDYGLLTRSLIALALAALESNNAEKALQLANESQQRAERGGNKESHWLACLVAARAQQRLGNETEAQSQKVQAEKVFADVLSAMGEYKDSYLARKDIEFYQKQPG
jgi:hypothetical protein